MVERGWQIRLVPVWPKDLDYLAEAARRIGRHVEILDRFQDLDLLLDAIRTCRLFVGQKLHSVVFASAVYVPSISLAYHPKCVDFQRSLDRGEYAIGTDEVSVDRLVAKMDELMAGWDDHRRSLFHVVSTRRTRLEECAARIGTHLAGRAADEN
jgi:polysaccharide pyruvyl transferase WcaK-like protein